MPMWRRPPTSPPPGSTAQQSPANLRSWDESEVQIAAPAGEQRIAIDQLISLRWPASPPAEQPAEGRRGIGRTNRWHADPDELAARRRPTRRQSLSQRPNDAKEIAVALPAAQLAAVRFQHLDDALAKQWDEIRQLNLPNDFLVVLKRDGKSLDYVEGVLGEITDDKVEFKLKANRIAWIAPKSPASSIIAPTAARRPSRG